ncbi:putative 3'-5' exonuclease related to the exonuclease domain of PolB [candidate division SR1 bacterium Aalborg_AAW-1]|nr:putative 3'-5' exonuclease related to the exonuclease domain of PolB [candidate division SR1 bacterium Aalborg_AAW-1]
MANIIYFDIETVSGCPSYTDLSDQMKKLWDKKCLSWLTDDVTVESLYIDKAGIFAEFGKIVCISCGYYTPEREFISQSFAGQDEHQLLSEFFAFLEQYPSALLCGHNIKEFDIPYTCRRGMIQGLTLPAMLNMRDKKPREIPHKDTMEMRKFGDYKAYTSLALLCEIFGIHTPKDDIDGSQVGRVFWEQGDIDRIVTYCEKDVWATAQLYQKIR